MTRNEAAHAALRKPRPAARRGVAARAADRVARRVPDVDTIHQRVQLAIVEHRLPPGTKLGEERLAAVFGVSRTQIRQVLKRLAHNSIVTVQANRGAVVSSPTVEEAREVFAARRLIEPDLIRKATLAATLADIKRLRRHVGLESAARVTNDKRAIIRLTGEFHQLIAELAGNRFLARTLRELETLTCLVIILYDAPNNPACPPNEHGALVDAIEARDAGRAAALMQEHLRHVEGALDFARNNHGEIDFDAIFS